MNILEGVLASTGSLTLPQNRLTIELRAFPIVWSRSDSRARALINQMAGEFSQAASSSESNDENPETASLGWPFLFRSPCRIFARFRSNIADEARRR
jgi:hypothetical protein